MGDQKGVTLGEGTDKTMGSQVTQGVLPSHHLATTLGLNVGRIQTMKASFFSDDKSAPIDQSHLTHQKQPILRPITVPQSKLAPPPPVVLSNTFTRLPVETLTNMETTPIQQEHPSFHGPPHPFSIHQPSPLIVQSRDIKYLTKETTLEGHTGYRLDMGATLGRSFRVGWGPNWTICHCGLQTSPAPVVTGFHDDARVARGDEEGYKYHVMIERVSPTPWLMDPNYNKRDLYDSILSMQLDHSHIDELMDEGTVTDDEGFNVPFISPANGQDLLNKMIQNLQSISNESELQLKLQFSDVFELVHALWGTVSVEGCYDNEDGRDLVPHYLTQFERKRRLSKWLSKVLRRKSDQYGSDDSGDYLDDLFNLLVQHRLVDGCGLAHRHGDHTLALHIAQASSCNWCNMQQLERQLNEWDEREAQKFINKNRLKIYMLLSGVLKREFKGHVHSINLLHSLNWRQVFGLYFWYTLSPTESIGECLNTYRDSFKDGLADGGYAVLPYPLYYQPVANEEAPFDTCYHLLNLFVQRGYDLNLTFAPSGSTPHQLDYRLSWYLWIILSDIAFVHLDLKDLALLHVNFAIQLEAVGLWVWSIFVLQHLNTPSHRGRSVWEVLCRNCSHQETLTEEETFVIERLKVPCGLMHRAKVISRDERMRCVCGIV
jgi:nuclear pore complex protein Nup98-Nup96